MSNPWKGTTESSKTTLVSSHKLCSLLPSGKHYQGIISRVSRFSTASSSIPSGRQSYNQISLTHILPLLPLLYCFVPFVITLFQTVWKFALQLCFFHCPVLVYMVLIYFIYSIFTFTVRLYCIISVVMKCIITCFSSQSINNKPKEILYL